MSMNASADLSCVMRFLCSSLKKKCTFLVIKNICPLNYIWGGIVIQEWRAA